MQETQLIFFPDYRRSNPYQALLYQSCPKHWTVQPGTPEDAVEALDEQKQTVFHLHWTSRLFKDIHTPADHDHIARPFLAQLNRLQERGVLIIWTIHNRLPHHCPFPRQEIAFRNGLAALADLIHIHDEESLPHIREVIDIPEDKIIIGPHGPFTDYYPTRRIKRFKRNKLGFSKDQTVFGVVGQLRPSRGIEDFINSIEHSDGTAAFVAGKPTAPAGRGYYANMAEKANIPLLEGFIHNKDLTHVIEMADWVVLPYREILTSGGLILALSMGRPAIVPDLAPFKSWKGKPFVRFYNANEPDGLTRCLTKTSSLGRHYAKTLGCEGQEYVSTLSWKDSIIRMTGRADAMFAHRHLTMPSTL